MRLEKFFKNLTILSLIVAALTVVTISESSILTIEGAMRIFITSFCLSYIFLPIIAIVGRRLADFLDLDI